MSWLCTKCGNKLARAKTSSVSDSDGISGNAEVTDWRCPSCTAAFSHWHLRRAAVVDGKLVDAGKAFWFGGDEPKFAFDSPWRAVSNGAGLEAELARELTAGHPLHGKKLRALAHHGSCDDVVFTADDGLFYVVHLTWKRAPEEDPRWPTVTKHYSIEAFAEDDDEHEDDDDDID